MKSSDDNNTLYDEINRMVILFFCDIFNHEQVDKNFNVHYLDRVKALTWIRRSTIGPSRRIVHPILKKMEERKKPVNNSTIKVILAVVLN